MRLRLGPWLVHPASHELVGPGGSRRIEPQAMRTLLCLAQAHGEVVSKEALRRDAWDGLAVSDDALWRSISELRRVLGDDPRRPTLIETVPKLGYRLRAAAERVAEPAAPAPVRAQPRPLRRAGWAVAAVALLLFTSLGARPTPALGVLPFEVLGESADAALLARGLHDELRTRLGCLEPERLRVDLGPEALESLVAKGVRYAVGGTVQPGSGVARVTITLVLLPERRQVWAMSYDRDAANHLDVQREIADDVVHSLAEELQVPPETRRVAACARPPRG